MSGEVTGQLALTLVPELSPHTRAVLAEQIEPSWRTRAGCVGADPRLFDPDDEPNSTVDGVESIRHTAARAICNRCPVRTSCLSVALLGDENGIWGATTDTERDAIRESLAEVGDQPSPIDVLGDAA